MNNVTERPILFSSDMVRAIFDGRKTQTRRVMKPQPVKEDGFWKYAGAGWTLDSHVPVVPGHSLEASCPYGKPADLLYVRETFAKICSEGDPYCHCSEEEKEENHYIEYKADTYHEFRGEGKYDKYPGNWDDAPYPPGMDHHPADADFIPRWKPSIHMPKALTRIWLKVEDIRIERVKDISEEDAIAEGIKIPAGYSQEDPPSMVFADLWDSINADRGYPGNSNPWVWVVEFSIKTINHSQLNIHH